MLDALDGVYDGEKRLTGVKLLKGQFWALLVKRFHHTRRNRKGFVSQVELLLMESNSCESRNISVLDRFLVDCCKTQNKKS